MDAVENNELEAELTGLIASLVENTNVEVSIDAISGYSQYFFILPTYIIYTWHIKYTEL